ISDLLEQRGGLLADRGFVLVDEHVAFGARLALRARRLRALHGRGTAARQIERDGGALPDPALHVDHAPRLVGEAIDLAQAEAGALANLLGGEEWVEDLLDHLRRNADAGVAQRDLDVIAGDLAGRPARP